MLVRRFTIALLAIAASAAAVTFPPINYHHRTLANGLEVYSIEDHATPTVAINVWYRVGSKNDPEGRSGFAHLFEHIMFKATAHMKSEMLDRLTEDVGGMNNAYTHPDRTVYYEVVPSNYLQTLLWAEGERMGSLTVDEANAGIIGRIGALALYGLSLDEINRYIGGVQSVRSVDVQKFAAAHLAGNDASIVIVGDAKKFLPALQQRFKNVEVIPIDELDVNSATLRKAK